MPIVFTKGTVSTGPFGGRGGVSGDFNGDGLPDLAVTTIAGDQLNIYLAQGDGTFQQPAALSKTGGQNLSLISFDGDKDGKLDLLAADYANGGVYVFKGVGNGTFLSPSRLGTVGNAHSLGVADFDGNGYLDFVVSGYSSSQVTVGKLGANISIVSAQTFSSGGAWARGIATGDFNKDGNTDFVVSNVNSNSAVVFYGPNFSTSLALSTGAYPIGAVSGDFNGDGRTDFVTSNYSGQSLSFFFQQSNGSFSRTDFGLKGRPLDHPRVTDVDVDGSAEVIVGLVETYQGVAVISAKDPQSIKSEYFATVNPVTNVLINDVNADGKSDFVAISEGSATQFINGNYGTPSYVITPSAPSVNEGNSVTFTIDTKNVMWGTSIAYTLTGISQSDLSSGSLAGTATVNQNGVDGRATVTVNLANDQTTAPRVRIVVP